MPDKPTTQEQSLRGKDDDILLAQRYELQEALGSGGWASVYRAHDRFLNRTVAVKIMHKHLAESAERRERFERECRTISRINHPNVCTVFDAGLTENHAPYMVMEYLRSQSLADVISDNPAGMPLDLSLDLLKQLCGGLSAAHALGILHRDIKPSNIVVNEGVAKLVDFGLAKVIEGERDASLTDTGQTLGTPRYMSPEQCSGQALTPASDVYSLACVAYEMLSGKPMFGAQSTVELMYAHLHQEPMLITSVRTGGGAHELSLVVQRALAKSVARRYQSAQEFASALQQAALKDERSSSNAFLDKWTLVRSAASRAAGRPKQLWVSAFLLLIATGFAVGAHYYITGARAEANRAFKERCAGLLALINAHDQRAWTTSDQLLADAEAQFGKRSLETSKALYLRSLAAPPQQRKDLLLRSVQLRKGLSKPGNDDFGYFCLDAGLDYIALGVADLARDRYADGAEFWLKNPPRDLAGYETYVRCVRGVADADIYLQRFDDALKNLQLAKEISYKHFPGSIEKVESWRLIARVYDAMGNHEKAVEAVQKGLEEGRSLPDEKKVWMIGSAAYFYNNAHKYAEAIPYFRKIIDLVSKHPDRFAMQPYYASAQLGPCLQACGKLDEAEKAYRTAMRDTAEYPQLAGDVYDGYASLLRLEHREAEARIAAETAAALKAKAINR